MSYPRVRDDFENDEEFEAILCEDELLGRYILVTKASPQPGFRDMLHVLTHPDVIDKTKKYIEARDAYNRSD